MNILVCIDDTDTIDSRGTGVLASELALIVESRGWGRCEPVTRHQLCVHPDIAYTSHNSAMCFAAAIDDEHVAALIDYAGEFLVRESAAGSDPGLCVVNLDRLADTDALMSFGRTAKQQVLTKADAYSLARRLHIHLSEHGGTGIGVIGALAGTGLRLTGNDGRFRGRHTIAAAGDIVAAGDIKQQTYITMVKSLEGRILPDSDTVQLGEKVKSVLLDGQPTLLVFPNTMDPHLAPWQTCTKEQFKLY